MFSWNCCRPRSVENEEEFKLDLYNVGIPKCFLSYYNISGACIYDIKSQQWALLEQIRHFAPNNKYYSCPVTQRPLIDIKDMDYNQILIGQIAVSKTGYHPEKFTHPSLLVAIPMKDGPLVVLPFCQYYAVVDFIDKTTKHLRANNIAFSIEVPLSEIKIQKLRDEISKGIYQADPFAT